MNNSLNNPQSNWKALTSLIFGIVCLIIPLLNYIFCYRVRSQLCRILAQLWVISFFVAILGLILGITGIKSARRNLAIIGIIFSIINLGLFIMEVLGIFSTL